MLIRNRTLTLNSHQSLLLLLKTIQTSEQLEWLRGHSRELAAKSAARPQLRNGTSSSAIAAAAATSKMPVPSSAPSPRQKSIESSWGTQAAGPRGTTRRARPAIELPDCCSYDQVYERIIELLNSTAAATTTSGFGGQNKATNESLSGDGAGFARALMDELEVSKCARGAASARPNKPPKSPLYKLTNSIELFEATVTRLAVNLPRSLGLLGSG